ncbi:MAG: HAMP domain-containing histidine kinase, partial [Cyanobacteria bacterium]|nr:HAMP domain-containing histidine kinase [Cyanobacteriota bacterium]
IEIDGDELSARTLSSLHALSAETQRLARLAHTLLDVDRMEDGKLDIDFVKVSAAELVKSSTAVQAAQAERRKIQLVENVEEGLELKCDVDRTIQVLTNLLSNALKFCPRNSTITVSAFSASDDWARFEVIDQGTGVPSEQAANLFVRFKQLDQPAELKTQGSGLGLFICKSLVEAQGGRIGYREREEPGACFWIELPRA